MDDDFSVADYLREQLALTRTTWARLREHGVTDGSELQLDFFYAAATKARAAEFKQFLEQETDYEVRVTADRDQWIICGHTQRASLSLAMVEQWVDWMVTAGLHFECVFDGWGAEAP
jgi:UDP-2,3-diacylglucosamine pyrophosphatase LpxH